MTRLRLAREIACGIVCARCLIVVIPVAVMLLVLVAIVEGLARLFAKAGENRGRL